MSGNAPTSTATGRSGTNRAERTTCRNATADTGSSFSGAVTVGGVTGVAGACGPVPMRTAPKSPSSGDRSHIRHVPASVHASAGSGWTWARLARCIPTASATARRTLARCRW